MIYGILEALTYCPSTCEIYFGSTINGDFSNPPMFISSVDYSLNSKMLDTTPFNAAFTSSRPSIKSMTFKASGFFDYYGDATGQRLIMDNAVNGSELAGKVRTSEGSACECAQYITSALVVSDFTITTNPHGMIEFSVTAESTKRVLFC